MWTGTEGDALADLIDKFNASQSDIKVVGTSNPDRQSQLASLTSSKGSFDISTNASIGAWASKGVITPLDDYIKRDAYDLADFTPVAQRLSQYEDGYFGLPVVSGTYGLLYNKTLFDKAGLRPPTTTDEWAEAMEALTVEEGGKLTQLSFGGMTPPYRMLGMAFGGQWYDEAGAKTPSDPGNIEAAHYYLDNVIKPYGVGAIQDFQSTWGEYSSADNAFYQGKTAMAIDGPWHCHMVPEFAPGFEWGVVPVPYPKGEPELEGSAMVDVNCLFIPANSQNKDGAWEFMKYLVSNDAMESFSKAISNLPTRMSLLESDAYDDVENFADFMAIARGDNAGGLPPDPDADEYLSDLSRAEDTFTRLKETPEEAYGKVAKSY